MIIKNASNKNSRQNSLRIATINMRGYDCNTAALTHVLDSQKYDVIGLVETWLRKDKSSPERLTQMDSFILNDRN